MARVFFACTPLLKTCIGGLCPSLTFLQLGSYLQAHGHAVLIHDIAVERETRGLAVEALVDHIVEAAARAAPDLVGLSTKVPADGRFLERLVPALRRRLPRATLVAGGIWATPCHAELLARVTDLDVVVQGEGEHALRALADRLDRGLPAADESIAGIAWRDAQGGLRHTARGPAVEPTELPPLDLGLLPHPDRYTVFPFLTSKGCPYACTFCSEKVINPHYVETPLEQLTQELRALDAFGHDWFLWLSDPVFGARPERLRAICEVLRESRFAFLMESRVDVLDPAQVPLLWEAGCELIYFGLEAASYETLRRIGKVSSERAHARYLDRARALMAACTAHDITPVFGVLNPVPGDTVEDLQTTYRFLEELAGVARGVTRREGTDPGFHFYAFDYRFIRGTADADDLEAMAARGATWMQDPADVFVDLVVDRASPTIPRTLAREFQRQVAGLVHSTPTGWERLQRSFPSQPVGGLG